MKRKNFLIWYTVCVVLVYSVAYVVIETGRKNEMEHNTSSIVFTENTVSGIQALNEITLPETQAEAAVVIDAKSGAVICEKNPDARLPMASTTKIMTAKIVLDTLSLDTVVTVPKEATLTEGSSIYLAENEKITVKDLLYGLLLESGNDAAVTLAYAVSGSTEEFAKLMNRTAVNMGLSNTSFANPHGLTAENHFVSAYELAYITMCAMKNETFKEMVSSVRYISPSIDGTHTRYFYNHNKLLRMYDGAIGVKTGYTEASGRCLVSCAERNGEEYICVTLNDRNDWADHTSLLDYAFGNFDSFEVAPKNGFAVNIRGNRLTNPEPVYITVKDGDKPDISYEITADKSGAKVSFKTSESIFGTFFLKNQE